MTEAEWLEAARPEPMLDHIRGASLSRTKAGKRKMRLFACGCVRQVWTLLPHEHCRETVVVAEQFADGRADQAVLETAREKAVRVAAKEYGQAAATDGGQAIADGLEAARAAAAAAGRDQREVVEQAMWCAQKAVQAAARKQTPRGQKGKVADEAAGQQQRRQAALLLDLFGNPFRPIRVEKSWLAANVCPLAEVIYEEAAFDRLPILADAMVEAGCHHSDILAHCRGGGEHLRGCWVVDLLTGRQ